MPARFSVDPSGRSIILQFTDTNGTPVSEPNGAQVDWTIDNSDVASVDANTNNPLEGDITVTHGGSAIITATITGVEDTNGQPYDPVNVRVMATPPQPARIMFGS